MHSHSDSSLGAVGSIYISAIAGNPMVKVSKAFAVKEKGLDGDRYSLKMGFWDTVAKPRKTIRDVSFIAFNAIENSGFTEAETRRNIIVHIKIDLTTLIGKYFYVGEALFKGIEECTPCKRPSELSGKPNFAQVFKNKGGLRAQVIESGHIREKDSIKLQTIP